MSSRKYQQIKICSVCQKLLNMEAKKKVYFAHIHSHLIYAKTTWSSGFTKKQKNNY